LKQAESLRSLRTTVQLVKVAIGSEVYLKFMYVSLQ